MLKDALIITLLIALIVFVITLIVLCIRLMTTLNKANDLIDNVTEKAKSLDGVFSIIDTISNKMNVISETVVSAIINIGKKLFKKNSLKEEKENNE